MIGIHKLTKSMVFVAPILISHVSVPVQCLQFFAQMWVLVLSILKKKTSQQRWLEKNAEISRALSFANLEIMKWKEIKNLQPTTTSVFVGEAMASPVKRPQLSLSDEVVQVGGFGVFQTGPLQMTIGWEGEHPMHRRCQAAPAAWSPHWRAWIF